MNRRRLLAGLGTAAAVGLAGCSGDDGNESGNGGNESDDAGGDTADPPFPDAAWRDGEGLDVETLATRHADAAVEAGGATLFSTAETTHDGDAEPSPWLPSQEYEAAYDLENGRQYVRQAVTETEESDVSELYVADGTAFIRRRTGDGTRYARRSTDRSADELESAMRSEMVTGIRVESETADGETEYEGLNLWNPASDGAGEVRGEETARFTADTFEGDRNIPKTVETASATVHVYESGVVPRLEQSWAGRHDGQGATVDVDIDYRDLGATVSEPAWVETAREETSG
ncbi:DUF7537 family lipoprotein [Halorubrum distributum]|uniref:Uncharacterized protein n=1 Tax=Halorubrum distributum TaxID=29283 RepID=A0A6B1IL74_9EURY|nr:hypothetical protein [Halorubrum terrestre]MYL66942.1 hypothetical protein [Halorubrum terrestre]PHQ45844.1 hypothetical protein DJ68_10600 [Halorubrum sp. C3]